eukprot:g1976.t1
MESKDQKNSDEERPRKTETDRTTPPKTHRAETPARPADPSEFTTDAISKSYPHPPEAKKTEEEDDDDTTNQLMDRGKKDVILSIFIQGESRIGAASYDTETAEIHVTQIFTWKEDIISTLAHLKVHVDPTILLISHSITSAHLSVLKSRVWEEDGEESCGDDGADRETKSKTPYVVLKTSAFSLDAARRSIHHLNLHHQRNGASSSPYEHGTGKNTLEDPQRIGGVEMIRATGALLSYVSEHCASQQLRRDALPLTVSKIEHFVLDDYLHVDEMCFRSLDIFQTASASSKEGFSLFMTLNRTCTSSGQRLLKNWMRKPLLTAHVLRERQRAVAFLSQHRVMNYYPMFASHLRKTSDLSRICLRIKKAEGSVNDWYNLKQTLDEAKKVADLSRIVLDQLSVAAKDTDATSDAGDRKILFDTVFRRVHIAVTSEVLSVLREIDRTIDFERSKEAARLSIRDDVSDELNDIRHFLAGIEDFLANVTNEDLKVVERIYPVMRELPWEYQYRPQVGFFVAVAEDIAQAKRATIDHFPPDFEYVFRSGGSMCFRTPRTKEMDKTFGDPASAAIDLEQKLVIELEETILKRERVVVDVSIMLSELDVLYAYAITVHDYNLVCPEIVHDEEENKIVVTKARHMLQEQTVDSFIPNDVILEPSAGFACSVVTGPNYSGKSVYLKSVGLVAYMTFIGMFVPCERCVITPIDRIFCRVKSYESATLGLSTFQIDCLQMQSILQCATSKSLVLVDEFGKGTSAADGLALFAASIESLTDMKRRGSTGPPKIVAVTHFLEALDILRKNKNVLHLHMETIQETRRIVPLFKLKPIDSIETTALSTPEQRRYHPSRSDYGLYCASNAGVSEQVVQRARSVFECMEHGKNLGPWTTTTNEDGDAEEESAQTNAAHARLAQYRNLLTSFLKINGWSDCAEQHVTDLIAKIPM